MLKKKSWNQTKLWLNRDILLSLRQVILFCVDAASFTLHKTSKLASPDYGGD